MKIEIKEAKTKKELKAFVLLPFSIYKNNANWAPPIIKDELKILDPQLNPTFDHCESKFWIALKEGKCVGRIGALVHTDHNRKTNQKMARFTRFECSNDQKVADNLLRTAENWAHKKGMKKIHGPLGFNNLDSQGVLVEGFDHLQSIASIYHLPYYKTLIEQNGYEKEVDWVEYRLTIGEKAVNKAKRGASLIKKRYDLEVVHFNKMEELLPYSDRIFDILGDAFSDLPFVTPFNQKTKHFYRDKYIRFLNPGFVKMVKFKKSDDPIGFIIGMPSLSKAMKKAKGKFLPFGWYHILKAQQAKNGDTMDQVLTGVLKEHQATGAGVILMAEIQAMMVKKGLKYIETTGIFETNVNAISNWKNYEHIQHKRKRSYVKQLS
ncbi:MAG TPA: GTP cyclohydrolase [Flavobacteriaceae bacterium]|nr:GTP cyclohydrolase [Flavobacteriaceae bacterium]